VTFGQINLLHTLLILFKEFKLKKMSNKLSDALATLSAKTKIVEDKIAQANAESKEKVEAKIDEAKINFDAQKAEFFTKTEALKNFSLKELLNAKIAQVKASVAMKNANIEHKIKETETNFDVKIAEAAYVDACHYAESCVAFTFVALADVEAAMLEAVKAKLKLDALQKT